MSGIYLKRVDDCLTEAARHGASKEPLNDGQLLVGTLTADKLLHLFVGHELESTLRCDLQHVDAVPPPHAPDTSLHQQVPNAGSNSGLLVAVDLQNSTQFIRNCNTFVLTFCICQYSTVSIL